MADKLDSLDYFSLLELEASCATADVHKAFRKFARKYHPDRFVNAPKAKQERANAIYRRGSEAYQVLIDGPSRVAYEAKLQKLRSGQLKEPPRLRSDERERAINRDKHEKARKKKRIASDKAAELFRAAVAAAKAKDFAEALRLLRLANGVEPNNDFIKDRLRQVEDLVRMRG